MVIVREPLLEEILDDYLRVVVRTHPWRKRREEEALAAFAAWLRERTGAAAELAAPVPGLARRYADAAGVDAERRERLLSAIRNLLEWGRGTGVVESAAPEAPPAR